MATIGSNLSPFSGQVKQISKTKRQQQNSEYGDDKENISHNRCSSSFDFELVSSLLEKRIDHTSTTPRAVLHVERNAEDSDIENCHHPSSARNSCGKDRLGNNYEDDDEDFCAESSNHLLESFLIEQEVPIPDTVETPLRPVIDPLKKQENAVSMSPTSTILTLKKGQRIKDGMILMLTGQVDRRKQLLLGAQEQAQRMSETLSSKESELSALQNKVKGLQHVVQGADGKIALLQFQLQKTKNVLKNQNLNQNQNQIASTSSTAAGAAPALTSAECSSASSQVVDNAPIVLNIEAKNVPHSSALASPDRTSWLLHWRKSQNIMADIIVRSSGQSTFRTDKSERFVSNSTSPNGRKLENANEDETEGNSTGSRIVALKGQTKTPVTIYRETGTSHMTSSKHGIMSSENEKNGVDKNEIKNENITDDNNVKNGSTEHKLIAQERLNIRLTAQLKAWVDAQIDMHAHLASSEATQILDHRFQDISNPMKIDDKTKNLRNDNRDNRTVPEKDFKSISGKYESDDVSYDSNNNKGMTNKIEGKLLDLGSPFPNSISSSSPHIVNSLPVIRTLFKDINSRQIDDKINDNNNVNDNQNSKNNRSGSENRVLDQNYRQKNVTSSPQYSHLLLVENNYDDDYNNCSLISDYSCHLNRMINNTTNEAQNYNLNQPSKVSPSTPLLNKIFKNDDSSIKNKKDSSKTKSPNSKFSLKSPSLLVVDTVRKERDGILCTLSPLQEKLLRLNSKSYEITGKNMKNIQKSVSPKTNEKSKTIEIEEHKNHNATPSDNPIQLPRTYAESLSTVPTPSKTSETPGKIFGKLLARKTPTREKSPKKSPMKNRDLSSVSAAPYKTTDIDRIHDQNNDYLTSEKYGFDSKSALAEYLIHSKTDSETTSKNDGIPDSKNPDYGNSKNNTFSEKHGNSHKNGDGGIVEYRSLLETDSYLNLPVGRRAISRERGAATITQNKSSQLQAKLRALEIESAREREKNKGLFLLKEINSSKMLQSNLSSYSTSFRNSNNNNSSTKQNSEMKANNSNYDYQAETVRSRQNVTPKKSPFQKNRSVANDFALTVIENSTKLRGVGVSFSPPTRPTLSPSSFNKEMNRLKKENYSIRDDISRFRKTLQALRKECRGDNTAKYLQSVRAFDAISEMGPESNLESLGDCTRFQQKEKNIPQERATRNYSLPWNDDVSNNNVRYTAGQGQNFKNESKNTYGQKVGFEFNNEIVNGNGNLYGSRHREEMGARISTYAYKDDTYLERMDLVDCTDMNDSSVHSSSLLSNTPAPTQGGERGRVGSSARDREENNFYHTSHNNYSQYKQIL